MPNTAPLPAVNGTPDAPGRRAEKTREYSAGGASPGPYAPEAALDWLITEETSAFGDATWDRMRRDPGISAALKTLLAGVLARPLTVLPAREPEPHEDRATRDANAADYELSSRVAGFVTWAMENLDRPIKPWLWEALEGGLVTGDKLAEKVFAVEPATTGGEWAGYLRYDRLPFKPRTNWRYRLDGTGRVDAIKTLSVDGDWIVLPRAKFAVLTLGDRDGDPRGESALLPCWKPWSLRVQLWPDWFRFTKRHAEPPLVVTMPPDDSLPEAGAGGDFGESADRITATATAAAYADEVDAAISRFRNGSWLRLPYGADAKFLALEGSADVFLAAFRFTLEQIVQALLLTTTATLDTQHNSRAQSRTGQDVLGTFLMSARSWLQDFLEWQVFYDLVKYNFGAAVAARHTPRASLGAVEPRDAVELMKALSVLGYSLTEGQKPAADAMIGMPIRGPEDVEAATEAQRAGREAQQQQATADDGDGDDEDDNADDDRSTPQP